MPKPPPEEPWMRDLQQLVYDSLVLFAFGPEDAAESEIRNATCCAVQVKDEAFILTAEHVLTRTLDMISTVPNTICVVGGYIFELRGRPVYRSKGLDIATIPVSQGQIAALERDGRRVIRPEEWPPRLVEKDDRIIFGGFPGRVRRIESWDKGVFNGITSAGAVTSVTNDWFSYHGDPDDMSQSDVPTGREEDMLEKFDGISGGPVFRSSGAPSGKLELVGVVSQGTTVFGHPVFAFSRRLDVIDASGRIRGTQF
jgi:hypothetical protein